jgi:hypothetical protein
MRTYTWSVDRFGLHDNRQHARTCSFLLLFFFFWFFSSTSSVTGYTRPLHTINPIVKYIIRRRERVRLYTVTNLLRAYDVRGKRVYNFRSRTRTQTVAVVIFIVLIIIIIIVFVAVVGNTTKTCGFGALRNRRNVRGPCKSPSHAIIRTARHVGGNTGHFSFY